MDGLSERVAAYERLRSAVQSALPPLLKASVQVSPIKEDILVMRCANGTVHLRLRVLLPQILDALHAAGFVIKSVRLKVEPMIRPAAIAERKSMHRTIPEAGRIALERARQKCEGTPLADSIAKLLARTYGK